MKTETKQKWPDEARLKMTERSQLYAGPTSEGSDIYEFGYYDGYQLLKEQNAELLTALKLLVHNCEPPFPEYDDQVWAWKKAEQAIKNQTP